MQTIQYKIDVFEGPLDLLLHLISKHKLNINDIPIFELVEQYTSYVRQMEEADMEIASDFLEMAARLVYIKTVSLLPTHDEADELKKELTGELIEYQTCKLMAGKIAETADGFDYFYRQPMKIKTNNKYERQHEGKDLLHHYMDVVGRSKKKLPPPIDAFAAIVSKKIVSVASMVSGVFSKLRNGVSRKFSGFFKDARSKSEMVATFLAMLELIKANRITVDDDSENPYISKVESADEDYIASEFEDEFSDESEILTQGV